MKQKLIDHILRQKTVSEVAAKLAEGDLYLSGIFGSFYAPFYASLFHNIKKKHMLFVCESIRDAEILYEDLKLFIRDEVLYFPAWEVLPTDDLDPHADLVAGRMLCLDALQKSKDKKEPKLK